MCAFIVADNSNLPWGGSPSALMFAKGISFLAPANAASGGDYFIALLVVAAIWTATVCSMALYIAISFMLDWPQNGLLLRSFRFMGHLTATILFLPISGVLFRGMHCDDTSGGWLQTGVPCSSGGRIVTAIVMALFLAIVTSKCTRLPDTFAATRRLLYHLPCSTIDPVLLNICLSCLRSARHSCCGRFP